MKFKKSDFVKIIKYIPSRSGNSTDTSHLIGQIRVVHDLGADSEGPYVDTGPRDEVVFYPAELTFHDPSDLERFFFETDLENS